MLYLFSMDDKGFEDVNVPGGFSGKELGWSLWWLDNRGKVKRAGVIAFIVFDILLLGFGLWGLIDWLAIGGISEEKAIRQLTSPGYAQLVSTPQVREIKFGSPVILASPGGKLDVLIPVENLNRSHWAELTYRVSVGGEDSSLKKAFVLPGQSKFIPELGLESIGSSSQVELKVESRIWRRIDPVAAADYEGYLESRLDVEVSDVSFVRAPEGEKGGITKFTLINHTAFTYRDSEALVLLYRSGALVGINKASVSSLGAGESMEMEIFWFGNLPQITRTEVQFDVNIFDPDAIVGLR